MDPLDKKPELEVHKVEQNLGPSDKLQQIRTYQGDMASAISHQNETIVSIQRAQEAKNTQNINAGIIKSPEQMAEEKSRKTAILLFIGIIVLICLGGVGAWYAYTTYITKTTLPVVQMIPNKFILTDSFERIDILTTNKDALVQIIQSDWLKNYGPGTKQIQLSLGTSTDSISTADFFSLLKSKAPSSLVRAFNPLFMFGLVNGNPNHTFILIKLDSYDNAFAGMISWEKNMADDILSLFASNDTVRSIASQTPFGDTTIKNKDARILKDINGQTVLLYSFYNNNMLIITDNEETLKILLTHLDSEKLVR